MPDRLVLSKEFHELKEQHSGLYLLDNGEGSWIIRGNIHFCAEHDGLEDEYIAEILIPNKYPQAVPQAKEVGGRINNNFHIYSDKRLCLGAPVAVKRKFAQNPTLIGFTNNCLVPFLYMHSYLKHHGKLPSGELAHGPDGLIQFYKEEFQTEDTEVVLGLLRILTYWGIPGNMLCPCKSGKRLWKCHADKIAEFKKYQPPKDFLLEIKYIKNSLSS